MTKGYIAFIDMLGTSYRAQNDPDLYYESIMQFQQVIANSSLIFEDTGNVYVFSDCAYMESSSLEKMVRYLREVRSALLNSGFYIKGALAEGHLEARAAHGGDLIADPDSRARREKVVKGNSFGKRVAGLFADQEQLKGIGISIHKDLSALALKRSYVVESCHVPHGVQAETFFDIRFEEEEIGADLLENTMKDLFRASTRAGSSARYYIALLATWIRSSDFSAMSVDPSGHDLPDSKTPPIYDAIMRSMFSARLGDVSGVEYVFLILLDKIYTDCGEGNVIRVVTDQVTRRKRIIKRLENLPAGILSLENRERLEKYFAKTLVMPSRKTTKRNS